MNNKMAVNTYLSIITLNTYELNAPIKRHLVAEWITKQDRYTCCLQETHFRLQDTHSLKIKGCKKILHASGNTTKSWGSNTYTTQNRL